MVGKMRRASFGRIILKGLLIQSKAMPSAVGKQLLTCYWILVDTHFSWVVLEAPEHLNWMEAAAVHHNK